MSNNFLSITRTPTKSTISNKEDNSSPKKSHPNSTNAAKMSNSLYRIKTESNQSAEISLIEKLIEKQIQTQDHYQNLLIHNKELEIKLLALQEQAQSLRKDFKKNNKPIQQIKAKIQNAKLSLIQKQKYLEKFYFHLDSKLQSNMHSNKFSRLGKIEAALQQKYNQQKQQLYQSVALQREKIKKATQELQGLRQYRDELIKAYTERAIQISSHRNSSQKQPTPNNMSQKKSHRKQQKKVSFQNLSKENKPFQILSKSSNKSKKVKQDEKSLKQRLRQENRKQCEYLKQKIQKLRKQKQIAQKDETLLKLLLNIDEQHKKYSAVILGAYKKVFSIKYREILTRKKINSSQARKSQIKEPSPVSSQDLQFLQKELKQKIAERKVLKKEIQQRNNALQKIKLKLNEQIADYSHFEQQVMKMSNKKLSTSSGANDKQITALNSRLSYTANMSAGNHRSTYTSYQKHSQKYEEDL